MNPLNPIFCVIVYLIAIATGYLLNLKFKITNDNARYETIDGMRGFLALGVFIHHSTIWYQYLHINAWDLPKSNLYTQLGQTSVSFFFMITAFLFVTKLLNTNTKEIDWDTLYVSRFFRLVPMYLVSISAIVLIIFIMSNWKLEVTIIEFFKELFYWGTFTMLSTPPINNSQLTEIINAGVVWSLPYEWWFYFSLPIISLLILRKGTSKFYMIMSLLFVVGFYKYKGLSSYHVLSFVGGAIAPFIIKYGQPKIKFNSIIFSIILLVCLAFILFLPITDKYTRKVLTIVVFNLIALGNSVFGILKSATLKFLGEISYSTYLIHGIIIFTVMYFYFGFEAAANLSATEFCLTIFSITPIVVFISFLSYKNIEKPFMAFSKRINVDKIKHRITGVLIPQRVPKK